MTTIPQTIQQTIGSQLISFYQLGSQGQHKGKSAPSGINSLAVVESRDSIHQIRQAIRPIHQPNQPLPYIATPTALTRHLQLNPLLAHFFHHSSQRLLGQPIETEPTAVSVPERIGLLAGIAIEASKIIAPQLLNKQEAQSSHQTLDNLAAHLQIGRNIQTSRPIQTLASIQAYLAQWIATHPDTQWQTPAPTGAPPLVDALVAIYERQDQLIFILPDWPPDKIKAYLYEVDWSAVSESLTGQYKSLQITTPSLFRLMLQYHNPADHFFQNYNHAWGINALTSLEIPRWRVYQDLARFASQMEVHTFPQAFITAENHQLNRFIHDYQNKLLNIQLREELLYRLTGQERVSPPTPLPERTATTTEKVDATHQQFNWWANHYTEKMNDNN